MTYPKIKNKKIKIAVVGCGRISRNHIHAIQYYHSDLALVAICDVNQSKLLELTKELNISGYTDLQKMLQNEIIDLVVLCTPSGLHSEQAIIAAKYGKSVVSEKPMATRFSDGIAMVKACDEANVRLFVVKQNRHNETLQLLKKAIDDERFGEIKLVQLNVFWTRPQEYYDEGGGWRGTWEFDGGAFMNQASHYMDLLNWMIGPVESVNAMMSTSRKIQAEDTGVLNIKWRNGALGSVAVTMLTYPKNLEGSITVIGEKGTVRIGGVAVNNIERWDFSDKYDYDNKVESVSYDTTSVYGFGHTKYYENVISTMRGISEPLTDGREGLKSLEVLTAAYLSARDNKSVGLPLNL